MFLRMTKYHRLRDYYSVKSLEVKFAFLFTLIFAVSCYFLGVYNDFILFETIVADILLGIIAGEFSLLGMTLAGMAIITSLVTPEIIKVIEKNDKDNDVVGRLMSQFEFSAFNLIIQIGYILLLLFILQSKRSLCEELVFYTLFTAVCYHLFFNIFYILSLVGNCIRFFEIKNKCFKLIHIEKTKMDLANEVRIDFLLSVILNEKNIGSHQLVNYLDEIIDKSTIVDKNDLKNYLHNYYSIKE